MEGNLLLRTKEFGISVIKFARNLNGGRAEDIVLKQLIRSATSVGANYRSALRSRSMPDFISRISIAEEEADETCYWFEIIAGAEIFRDKSISTLHQEAKEITAMLTASGRTAKQNFRESKSSTKKQN